MDSSPQRVMFKSFKLQIILVIITSVVMGVLIVNKNRVFTKIFHTPSSTPRPVVSGVQINSSSLISPSPFLPLIDQTSNLSNKSDYLSPTDLSPDFEKLKKEANSF